MTKVVPDPTSVDIPNGNEMRDTPWQTDWSKQKGKSKSTQMGFEPSFLRDISEMNTPLSAPMEKKSGGDSQVVQGARNIWIDPRGLRFRVKFSTFFERYFKSRKADTQFFMFWAISRGPAI